MRVWHCKEGLVPEREAEDKMNRRGCVSDLIGFDSDLVRVDARVFSCGLNGTLHWIMGYLRVAGLKTLKCFKCPVDLCY